MRHRPLLLIPLLVAATVGCGDGVHGDKNTYPGIGGHTWFPLAGTAHEPTPVGAISNLPAIYCSSCHPGGSFKPLPKDPTTWIDCKTCHFAQTLAPDAMAPHVGNVDYAAKRDALPERKAFCMDCHPRGEAYSGLNHARFPIGAGTRHNRACAVCHTTFGAATTNTADANSRSNAVKFGTLTCVTCHMNQAPFVGVFPAPRIDLRHLPPANQTGGVPGGVGLVRDYPAASIAPKDCMRCHDPVALAPSAGAGNLTLRVASHGTRLGHALVGSGRAGPWDGTHGPAGQSVACWTCHGSVPPLFPIPSGPSAADRPWAQDWSVGPPKNACTFTAQTNPSQKSCCTDCHGNNPGN